MSFGVLALLIFVVPASLGALGIDVPVSRSPLSFRWDAASGNVDHYNVYVSVDDQHFELLEEATTNSCLVDVQEGMRSDVVQLRGRPKRRPPPCEPRWQVNLRRGKGIGPLP